MKLSASHICATVKGKLSLNGETFLINHDQMKFNIVDPFLLIGMVHYSISIRYYVGDSICAHTFALFDGEREREYVCTIYVVLFLEFFDPDTNIYNVFFYNLLDNIT